MPRSDPPIPTLIKFFIFFCFRKDMKDLYLLVLSTTEFEFRSRKWVTNLFSVTFKKEPSNSAFFLLFPNSIFDLFAQLDEVSIAFFNISLLFVSLSFVKFFSHCHFSTEMLNVSMCLCRCAPQCHNTKMPRRATMIQCH